MDVLFLDVDGVLNSADFFKTYASYTTGEFNPADEVGPEHVYQLNHLLQLLPDLKIVLSSTWRLSRTVPQCKELMRTFGLPEDRLIDKTPNISLSSSRGLEIQYWLTNHPEVTNFVILDDDSDMHHLLPYLVQTSFETGLTEEIKWKIYHRFAVV